MDINQQLKLVLYLLAAIIISTLLYKQIGYKAPALPDSLLKQHWGATPEDVGDTSTRPFQVVFEEEIILNLKDHLAKHNPPKQKPDVFDNHLNTVMSFWKDQYNFKEREKFLNKYPQYRTKIQGLNIHFLHVKPEQTNRAVRVLPLLLLHCWTGSVRELYEIIPLLMKPRAGKEFVFEVIAPSLPGCGFSQAPTKPGLGELEASIILRNLMNKLGYDKFVVQGIDGGSVVGAYLVTLFPDEVIGYHSNRPVVHASIVKRKMPSKNVNKNPATLATYILDNLSTWSNYEHGEFTDRRNLQSLVDNLMIRWVSNTTLSFARLHVDTLKNNWKRDLKMSRISTKAPAAFIRLQNDTTAKLPRELRVKYRNVVHYTTLENAGRFTTFNRPQFLANDVWEAVNKFL